MRKYIVTDHEGRLNGHRPIAPGRYVNRGGEDIDPFHTVRRDCYDSPLLAVLLSPVHEPTGKARLFSVGHWGATDGPSDTRGYTVIKEVPNIPAVEREHRVDFAVAVIARMYHDHEFRDWARTWLSGADRTATSAQQIQESIRQDLEALRTVDELAGGEAAVLHNTAIPDLPQRAAHAARAAEMSVRRQTNTGPLLDELAHVHGDLGGYAEEFDFASLAAQTVPG